MSNATEIILSSLDSCGRTEKLILTLHEKGAQQLVGGHRFDLCSQVDVSPNHQRCSPEPQDPAERPNHQDYKIGKNVDQRG